MKKLLSVLGKVVLVSAIALTVSLAAVQAARAAVILTVPAAAVSQQEAPPAVGWADAAFVLATVAFFKAQLNLQKKQIIGLAIGLCILVALGPRIEAAVPEAAGWLFDIVGAFKLAMYVMGGYDFLTDIGPKMLSNG